MAKTTEQIEFIDCGSLSLNYDATGRVSISLSIVKNSAGVDLDKYSNLTWGEVEFDTVVTNASQKALVGSINWYEWSLQLSGVGNSTDKNSIFNQLWSKYR
jgi:hypothetical protein